MACARGVSLGVAVGVTTTAGALEQEPRHMTVSKSFYVVNGYRYIYWDIPVSHEYMRV